MQFLFGDHVLDVDRRELRRGSEAVAVGPQVLDLLVYLLENRDRVVSKDNLIDSVWGGRIVSESTLTSRINAARTAVGDSGEQQRLIKTLPRKGFRFVGEVLERRELAATETDGLTTVQGPNHPMAPPSVDIDIYRRPALAVLPFANISGDSEQDYFADGLTEDIITALSRCRAFPVISRHSTFAYKGKSPDIREVGKALGARYVVQGSVRKAGNRVRVTAQFINAETGHHIWAERYDRQLDDIFALQDEITARIAAIIEPAIAGAEQKQLAARPPRELSAWDLCIQGQYLIYESTKDSNQRAREKFKQAVEIDPGYARAWSGLAYTHMHDLRLGYAESRDGARRNALEAARRAVELDDTDADAHAFLGRALNISGQTENALEALRHALDLNPQNPSAIMSIGVIHAFQKDDPEGGIRWLEKLLEVSPLDPRIFIIKTHLAVANICAGKYERAAELARDATRQRADYLESHAGLAAALGYLGRASDAAKAIGKFRDRVVEYVESYPLWNRTTKDTMLTGLRRAGLVQ
jgi:TolB-like protein/Flp pilus assembly protein TadD